MNNLNFRTLDLNLLRVFDEVMTERNLTRAANNLAMTQPAVSNALRPLARGPGRRTRAPLGLRAWSPRPPALALWPTVRDALHMLRESLSPGDFDPSTARNAFVLAMADATAAKLIPGLMDIFESEAPNANLRVLPLTTRDPQRAAGVRHRRSGDRSLSWRIGRTRRPAPARAQPPLSPPAAVRRRVRGRHAADPPAGGASAQPGHLLRGAPPAGELLGSPLRFLWTRHWPPFRDSAVWCSR